MLSLAELDKSNVFVASLNSLILAVTPTDVIQFILQPPLFTQSAKILRFFTGKSDTRIWLLRTRMTVTNLSLMVPLMRNFAEGN